MKKKISILISISAFAFTAGLILVLLFLPDDLFYPQSKVQQQSRVVIPRELSADEDASSGAERLAYEESINAKVPLDEGEALVTLLTQDIDGDQQEEQIIAYRNLLEGESSIHITYVDFDNQSGVYRRLWQASTPAVRPGTVSLYTQDMIGDRSVCILLSGMNAAGEHTLTIFRNNPEPPPADSPENRPLEDKPFDKIAELVIDGSITIKETGRTQAYQRGISGDKSFDIAAYGRDRESANILDQVEVIYSYNPAENRYEPRSVTRMPGTQIEQRRIRELLSGGAEEFETFIGGLWYYVGPQGTLDNRQYIYFDRSNKELIFYGEEAQQVFSWQNSNKTRYGLYISCQNVSVTTLRRFMDIELESLDSIRVKVFEDVRLKIRVTAAWDGTYRKAGTRVQHTTPNQTPVVPYYDAVYNGSIGRLLLSKDGAYELHTEGTVKKGNYAFFSLADQELLELRPGNISGLARETYLVETAAGDDPAPAEIPRKTLTLTRVRLGVRGIQEVHEAAIVLALADEPENS
jgi:hypothetical protein